MIVRRILLILYFLGSLSAVRASDIMGADMTYRCIGQDSFEFTTIVYKDCNANWQIPAGVYQLHISAVSCSFTSFSLSPTLVKCEDITPVCGSSCSKCISTCNASSSNGSCSFPYGIEKLTYTTIVYLGNTTCCKFHIGYIGNSTRNYATTTCCNSDLFYTYVELDRCSASCNSSPILTNDPIAILCVNQDFVFNNGAMDTTDGDSLSFELAPALRANNSLATYFSNFTYQRPLNFHGFPNAGLSPPAGFHLDPTSGDLMFRPVQANQISVIVIKIKEWRKINGTWTVISETRRDMQVMIVACPNNKVPKIKSPYVKQACAGQKVCMDIITEDDNTSDTVTISWNKGISGATFTNNNGQVKNAYGEVCWTPTDQHVSNIPYTFTITAVDNACPLKGQSIRSFSIFVRETPRATPSINVLSCGKVALNFTPDKQYNGLSQTWAVRDLNNKTVWTGSDQNDTAFIQTPGTYLTYLTLRTPTPCLNIYIDTVVIPDFVQVTLPEDTVSCGGHQLFLTSSTKSGTSPYTYEWINVTDSGDYPMGQTQTSIYHTPDSISRLVIQVRDAQGCYNYDSITVLNKPLAPVYIGSDRVICEYDQVTLDAGNDSTTLLYLWETGDTTRTVNLNDEGNWWVRITDSLGCHNYDTIHIAVNEVRPYAGADRQACQGDTITLYGSNADSLLWFDPVNFSPLPYPPPLHNGSAYTFAINKSLSLILRGEKTEGDTTCYGLDTINITMNPLPTIEFQSQGPFCPEETNVTLNSFLKAPTGTNGTWYSPVSSAYVTFGIFHPKVAGPNPNPGHEVRYRLTDAKGCIRESSTFVRVFNPPPVKLTDTFSICADAGVVKLNTLKIQPAVLSGFQPYWYSVDNLPQVNNAILTQAPHSSTDAGLDISKLNGGQNYRIGLEITQASNQCTSRDTVLLRVKAVPLANAGTINPVCWNDPLINLNTAAQPSPAGGSWFSSAPLENGGTAFLPASVGDGSKFTGALVRVNYVVSVDGCSDTATLDITVKGLPTVQLVNTAFCEDITSVDLNSVSVPGGTGSQWSGPGISANIFTPATAGAGVHAVIYNYTAPNGCKNADTGTLSVHRKPELQVNWRDAICEGEEVNLEAHAQNAGGVTWSSSGDGSFTGNSSTSTDSFTRYTPGPIDIVQKDFVLNVSTNSNSACPEASRSQQVTIYATPDAVINAGPLQGCHPLDVTLEAVTNASPGAYIHWDLGDGTVLNGRDELKSYLHSFQSGNFTVSMHLYSDSAFGYCRQDAVPVLIKVFPTPDAKMDASRWVSTTAAPGVQFYDRSTISNNGVIQSWAWSFGDLMGGVSSQQHPYYTYPVNNPADTGLFLVTLRVETPDTCWDTTSRYFYLKPDITVFIPTSFTPNNIGKSENNRFFVVADGYETFEISIYNRWGELLYRSDRIEEGWDGSYRAEPAQQDVYVYVVKFTANEGKPYEFYGTVTLLR